MSERDCSHCRNHTDDGCKKWECEYVPNDLIKRQDAIDAISTWDKFGVDERNRLVRWYEGLEPYGKLRDVVWAIVKLPSAEPEIIRCKDCRKHNIEAGYYPNDHVVHFLEDSCPLIAYRGKAQGHEFDYQYCVCAEGKDNG